MDHAPSRRRVLRAAGLVVAVGLAGCTGGDDGEGDTDGDEGDETVAVGPGSLTFEPATVDVAVGETVRWVWESNTHTVTPESIPTDADWEGEPDIYDDGHAYEHTFEVAGTYDYYCEPHRGQGMEGSVVVEDG